MTIKQIIVEKKNRILKIKQELRATDYNAIKYAEGELTSSEYAAIRAQRRAWRVEINTLESEIKTLAGVNNGNE